MPDSTRDGQPPERPESVRQQQIAAIPDPKVRGELEAIARERDALVKANREERQKTFNDDRDKLRDVKVRSAHGEHPAGMTPVQYQGPKGFERATNDATAQITDLGNKAEQRDAKPFNQKIDTRLDDIHGLYVPHPQREQFQKLNREVTTPPPEAPAKVPPAQAARSQDAVKRETPSPEKSAPPADLVIKRELPPRQADPEKKAPEKAAQSDDLVIKRSGTKDRDR